MIVLTLSKLLLFLAIALVNRPTGVCNLLKVGFAIRYLIVIFIVSETVDTLPDECKNADVIPFDAIRMYAYERHTDENPLCDRNVINETKWYKATDDMVTNATKPEICGTTYALWLSGKLCTLVYVIVCYFSYNLI